MSEMQRQEDKGRRHSTRADREHSTYLSVPQCDGQRPSCSKCAKAGTPCIDVDTHGAGGVPRAFVQDAQARLTWLEDLVRTRLPDVDLDAGPGVPNNSIYPPTYQSEHPSDDPAAALNNAAAVAGRVTKRSLDQAGCNDILSIPKRVRRMAADLGVFSVNPNGLQTQYLGSSSGSFFAALLADPGPEHLSESDSDEVEHIRSHAHSVHDGTRSLLVSLKETLPPREDCDRMVRKFFSFYHADYPVLHQPSVFDLVDALYASALAPSDCRLQHNAWPATIKPFRYNGEMAHVHGQQEAIVIHLETGVTHLFFILSIAAELQARKRRFAVDPKPFFTQAMVCLRHSVAEVSLPSAQSLVLYVLYSFLSAGSASTWVILHIATSYAIDIGLQRTQPENSARHTQITSQMRRRVFLTIYTLER